MNIALLTGVLFALSYGLQIVLQQIFVRGSIQPLHLNFLSYATASVIFVIILGVTDKKALIIKSKKGWVFGLLVAFSGSVVADLLVLFGLQLTSSINWSLLSRFTVIVTFILAVIFLKEKIIKTKIIAVILGLVGVLLVVYQKGAGFQLDLGVLFFIGAVVCMSINNILSQVAMRYITSPQLTFIRMSGTAVMLGIIVLVTLPIKQVTIWPFIVVNSLLMIFGLTMLNYTIRKAGVAFFAMTSTLVPVFTVIFSALILKTLPTTLQIMGGTLIVGSIFLFEKKKISHSSSEKCR